MSGTDRARGFGITLKIFAATTLVVVAILGVTLALISVLAKENAERSLDRRLANTSEVARRFIEAENAKLASGAAAAGQNPNFIAAIQSGSGNPLDQANNYKEILGADYTLITDNHGVLLGRTDRPGAAGDSLGGSPLIGGALQGRQTAGYVNQADQRMYLAVATPLKVPPTETGVVQAVLLATHQVTDSLADEIKRATGSDMVFFVLGDGGKPVVMASSVPRSSALDEAIRGTVHADQMSASNAESRVEARIDNVPLVGFNRTLVNPGVGSPMGGYLALRSLDEELAAYKRLQTILYAIAAAGILLALAASYLVARQIAAPVRSLVDATNRVAEGDYSAEVTATSKDEIGQLAAAFKRMVEELQAKQQLVDFLSGSAGGAATQPIYTAGGDVASPTMVRSIAGSTGMLAVGQTLAGRYEIKSVLGMGGMGVVYRAMDRELGEPVAIKTLKGDAMASDPALLQRFKDEIRLARKITHRNVVRTHDLGEVEGVYYITMEFVEGQSLKHLIQSRGHLPVNVTLTVGKQLCRALEVAHEQGVIHRDIKPQNLILDPGGTLKVMDFGIARLATRTEPGATQAGMAIGTPEYMAPEQLLGDNVDFRADLYAAACVLFECLTGRTPFIADSPITLVAKQLEETPVSPASLNADVPDALAQIILRTLSKDPNERPPSAAALHDELDAIHMRVEPVAA
ncbi:MAG TPA: protein kinase [Gemmatimonadales bacterium]